MESPAFRFKCQFLFNRTPQNETFGSCHFDLRVKTKIWNNLVWESPATNKEIKKKNGNYEETEKKKIDSAAAECASRRLLFRPHIFITRSRCFKVPFSNRVRSFF